MKPAPFDYVRPETLAEACELLAGDDDARIIAGGQTLIPMLAMRLARPKRLVDILRLKALHFIRAEHDEVAIGAVTRQVEVERSEIVRRSLPLLTKALPWVGHPPTRNRGTVGGSIANADPSAEIPLVAVTLGAEVEIANPSDRIRMPADEYFIGPMLTSVSPGDCVCAVHFPVWNKMRLGTGFQEVSARQSDFAFVAAAAQVALDEAGRCAAATLGLGGLGDRPVRVDVAALSGAEPSGATIREIVRAGTADLEASADLHASAEYRRRMAVTLGTRALEEAFADARSARETLQ